MTGQVIDVASKMFEVDAAGDDDDMLVKYSGCHRRDCQPWPVRCWASCRIGLGQRPIMASAAHLVGTVICLRADAIPRTREFMPGFGNDGAGGDDGDGPPTIHGGRHVTRAQRTRSPA